MVTIAAALVIMLFLSGKIPGMQSTIDLVNADTAAPFACETTYDCYTAISSQLGTNTIKLSCENNECIEIGCTGSDIVPAIDCWDGTSINPVLCSFDGVWKDSGQSCPEKECTTNEQCIIQADTDCDGELESAVGTCSNYRCFAPNVVTCANTTLFWNKWKFVIILLSVVLVFGGYVYYDQVLSKKKGMVR